ncbi:hypothetical protein LINGRAHAP2_LOCUS4969 [Linum grandiflorum]
MLWLHSACLGHSSGRPHLPSTLCLML